MSALIYLKPDLTHMQGDWIAQLMTGVAAFVRERQTQILPIVSGMKQDQPEAGVMDLEYLLDIQPEEVPWIYLVHGASQQIVPYPHPLNDPFDVSPELMVLWARRTAILIEVPELEHVIEEKKADPETDPREV